MGHDHFHSLSNLYSPINLPANVTNFKLLTTQLNKTEISKNNTETIGKGPD